MTPINPILSCLFVSFSSKENSPSLGATFQHESNIVLEDLPKIFLAMFITQSTKKQSKLIFMFVMTKSNFSLVYSVETFHGKKLQFNQLVSIKTSHHKHCRSLHLAQEH